MRTSTGSLNSVLAQIEIARTPCRSATVVASEDEGVNEGLKGLQEASAHPKIRNVIERHRGFKTDKLYLKQNLPIIFGSALFVGSHEVIPYGL